MLYNYVHVHNKNGPIRLGTKEIEPTFTFYSSNVKFRVSHHINGYNSTVDMLCEIKSLKYEQKLAICQLYIIHYTNQLFLLLITAIPTL